MPSRHAAAAAFNSYEYQVDLIEIRERIGEQLLAIEGCLDTFKSELGDEEQFRKAISKFQLEGETMRVDMAAQYDFLHHLTSRLLHSSPMNIVTEKELSDAERTILLEYMVIGATDALEIIERYDFENRLEMVVFEIDGMIKERRAHTI